MDQRGGQENTAFQAGDEADMVRIHVTLSPFSVKSTLAKS